MLLGGKRRVPETSLRLWFSVRNSKPRLWAVHTQNRIAKRKLPHRNEHSDKITVEIGTWAEAG